MASEPECKRVLDEKFQRCYEKAVLDIVCHSSDNMERLVDRCFLKLHGEYFPGEPVLFRPKAPSKQIKGVVVRQDGSTRQEEAVAGDKVSNPSAASTSELSYTVLVGHLEVNGVPERDLLRENKLPSKELIKTFIKTYAIRNSLTKNWRLTSDEKAAEYGLKTGSHHADVNQLLLRQQQQKLQYQGKSTVLESNEEEQHMALPVKVGYGSEMPSNADSISRSHSSKSQLPNGQALNGNMADGKLKELSGLNSPAVADTVGHSKQLSGGNSTNSSVARKAKPAAIEDKKLMGKATMDGYVIPKSKTTPSEILSSSKAASTPDSTRPNENRVQPAVSIEPCVTNGAPKSPSTVVAHQHTATHGCAGNSVTAHDPALGIKSHSPGVASGTVAIESSSDSVSVWDSDDDMVLSVVKKQMTPKKKDMWVSKLHDGGVGSEQTQESCKRSLLPDGQRPKVRKEKKKARAQEGKSREKAKVVKAQADSSSDDDVALIAYKNPSMSGSKSGGDQGGVQKKVGLKQATLFDLSKKAGSTIQSPMGGAPAALQQPVIPEVVHKYQKAESELDFTRMQQLLLQAASELSAQQRDSLPANMKAAVREKHEYLELRKKMKFAPAEEKVVIQKQLHAYRLKEAAAKRRVLQMRCEDTDLDLKPLPAARPVELPSEAVIFADVVCVTEFIRCYHGLLAPGSSWDDKKISAEMLMHSLARASAGDAQAVALVGEVMTMLIQTLVSGEELEDIKVLGVPIRDIPVNAYTASEMARLLFSRAIRGSTDAVIATPGACAVNDADEAKKMDDSGTTDNDAALSGGIEEDLLSRLGICEFPALTPDQNLAILSALCYHVLCSRSAETYVEDKHQECADAWKQRKADAKLLNPKKGSGEKQANAPDGDGTQQQLSKVTDLSKVTLPTTPTMPSTSPAVAAAAASTVADLGGEHSVDSDSSDRGAGLAAVLRQRRELAAKSARERELKLQQERIQREREAEVRRLIKQREAIEKQFTETVTAAKEVLRCRPLGFDRNHNRYWHFTSAKPGIYVEQGWVGTEMTYCVQPEPLAPDAPSDRVATPVPSVATTADAAAAPAGAVAAAGNAVADPEAHRVLEKAAVPNLPQVQDLDLEKTFPLPGKNQWLVYDSQKDIDALLMALHPRGIRENALADSLRALYPDLVRLMKAASAVAAAALPSVSSNAAAAPPARVDEQASAVVRFQEELEDLESRLLSGGLGGVNDFDSWSRSVHSASEIRGLAACLIECGEAILPKFLKGMVDSAAVQPQASAQHVDTDLKAAQGAADQPLSDYLKPEASSAAFCINKWKMAVLNTATLSRLHVLLGILEACVRWEKSAENAKCKVCRRKGNEDSLLLCDECNMAFHMHCLRPALSVVPEGEWFCPACKPCVPKRENRAEHQAQRAPSLGSRDGSLASDSDSDDSEASSQDSSDASDEEKEERADCCVCSESGRGLVVCSVCLAAYHLRCHSPPLRCAPVGTTWACSGCRATGEASSKKRSKQQPPRAKDRRRGRRDVAPDVSDKDSEYKSEDQESDDGGDREAARGSTSSSRLGKRLRSAADERRLSSAKAAVKRAAQQSRSRTVTGGRNRSRSSTGRIASAPAAVTTTASKATRTLRSLRSVRTAVTTLLDDEGGSFSDDQTSSSSIQPTSHSAAAKGTRAPLARSALTVAASRSTSQDDDDDDEEEEESPGKGGLHSERSRTNCSASGSRNGPALSSKRDRKSSKRRVMSEDEEDDCEGSASEEAPNNAVSSRRTRTGAAVCQSSRAMPPKRTVITDDSDEGDGLQPAKRRLRSVWTESSVGDVDGDRRQSAARQSKQLAAAAIRNGYKSVSSDSDNDTASDREGSGQPKRQSKAARHKAPASDVDDDHMPHLEPQYSDGDLAAAVSKRRKPSSEDDVRTIRKQPHSAESAPESSAPKILAIVLQKLRKHPASADFEEAVDPAEVPDYYDVIEHPITLADIGVKISKRVYTSANSFVSDVTLLFRNAFEYNKVNSEVGREAQRLEEEFVRLLGQHLPSQHYESQYKLFAAAAAAAGGSKASKRKR